MPGPLATADLERLEADIEEALIALIDRSGDDAMIADLQRRKLHLLDELARLRVNPQERSDFTDLAQAAVAGKF